MPPHLDYRPVQGEPDAQAVARILARAFAIPESYGQVALRRMEGCVRVLADGADVVACLGWYAFGQWLGGGRVACAGIAAVGVEPHRRGERLATGLMQRALLELADGGVPLAALYPSTLGLYRGVGFETAGGRYELRVRCDALPRARAQDGGADRVEALAGAGVDDPRVRACYERAAQGANGWLARNDAIWERVRDFRGEIREGYAVVRGGEVAGYLFLARRKRRDLSFDVACGDFVASDARAARALLAFLGAHSTLARQAILQLAPADPVVALLPDVGWEIVLHHPWMLRVLDLRSAFEARGWSPAVAGELHLEVADPLIAHNRGRFVVAVEGGRARVRPGGDGLLRADVRALGPLLSGHATAEHLAFLGLLAGGAGELARATALALLPAPTMPDFF